VARERAKKTHPELLICSVISDQSSAQIQPLEHQTPAPPQKSATSSKPGYDHSFVGMSGGQIFHEMMLRQGVKHVFGYPGGAILPVFDAIYNSSQFEFILPRAEQGAGHAAEGYARVT
jgi:acetolactate synthase-1/2/3 large subunit